MLISTTAAVKAHHYLIAGSFFGSLWAGAESAALYPDLRAFLIYACYGSLGGAALAIWTPAYRKLLKFLAVIFTGAATAGFVGPAAASWVGPGVAPLAAFLASLTSPTLIMDPLGTIKRIAGIFGRNVGAKDDISAD